MNVYEIDGSRFSTLHGFFDEISRVLIPGVYWGRNLDAFNDILRGGFGTPEGGFTLKWKNSGLSRERLGYAETAKLLEAQLQRSPPSDRESVAAELAAARQCVGPTVFDCLVEIIRCHSTASPEAEDGVELVFD
jgi:RNAse (barnase) inhibitor barstar